MSAPLVIAGALFMTAVGFVGWGITTGLTARGVRAKGRYFHAEVQEARASRFIITALGLAATAALFWVTA